MNRVTSSSNAQTKKFPQSQSQPQPQPPAKKERNLKRERFPVNPLRGFSAGSSGSSSCSNGSGSGSTPGEASDGRHRFLLSHSFSSSSSTSSSLGVFTHGGNRPVKSLAKTPKSAPVVSKPLIRKKPKFLQEIKLKSTLTEKPNLQKPQRYKTNPARPTSKITMKPEKASVSKKQSSVPKVKLKDRQTTITVDDSIAQITPVSKLGSGSDLIYRSNGEATDDGRLSNSNSSYRERTPPVQASISPEIQCGSSSMNWSASAQSQACYAAGHLLSGVSDKRKCKPKGILTVGENGFEVGEAKILNDFNEFGEGQFCNGGSYNNTFTMPLPADASVHWLLSPCDEEKEHEKKKYDDGFSQQIVECVGHETPSPLSDRSTSSDLCNISSLSPMNICKETTRRTSSSLSPNELSRFRRFMQLSSCEGEASPLDSTPTSELGPSEHSKGDKPSPLSVDTLGSGNVIQTPESNSSFDNYFGLLSSPAEIQRKHEVGSVLESLTGSLQSARLSPRNHASPQEPSASFNFDSLATSSDSIDLSQFQRVSWRKEINSHMKLKSQQMTDMRDNKEGAGPAGKRRELLPCSAAESMSTDGGGLICSEDSNWMECYKN